MSRGRWIGALAAGLVAMTPAAKAAAPDAESLLTQVKQMASQGQDSQTATQVNQFVDEHQDAITAVLKMYLNYLKQIQTVANENDAAQGVQPAAAQGSAAARDVSAVNPEADRGTQAAHVQPSTGLRVSSIQPSGGLQTGHLAGYPSLPDVDPTSSIRRLTAEQVAYAAKVRQENLARKEYLMEHPEGYTY